MNLQLSSALITPVVFLLTNHRELDVSNSQAMPTRDYRITPGLPPATGRDFWATGLIVAKPNKQTDCGVPPEGLQMKDSMLGICMKGDQVVHSVMIATL